MARSDLQSQAKEFGNNIQNLLNKTVCDYAQIRGAADKDRDLFTVGTDMTGLEPRPIQLRSTSSKYCCWLELRCSVYLEKGTGHLTVRSSYVGIQANRDDPDPIFHYDYERDKERYTEAHIQVFGVNEQLTPLIETLCTTRKKKTMGELHLPVGGRRYRPALEDLLEFLIIEGLVDPKSGWEDVLRESREGFRDIQLRAAVRRNPEVAAAALRNERWTVTPPPEKKKK